jgi:hypothetical protein
MKVKPEPAPPVIIYQPMIPPPPPPPMWPPLFGTGGLTAFMTDYSATLTQNNYPAFNFGEAFSWSGKTVFTEFSLGAIIPGYLETRFTWGLPVIRSGVGIPTVPLAVGGYTFGPRTADTIRLSTELSGKNIIAATPYFSSRLMMPTVAGEWWRLGVGVVGTPTTTTTSTAPVDVKQDFNQIILGVGVSGDLDNKPARLSYKALYMSGGGGTSGLLAQAELNYSQKNLRVGAGYRYNKRTISFGTGKIDFTANGPFAYLEGKFNAF